jgi:GT2 family glycosyltransferase
LAVRSVFAQTFETPLLLIVDQSNSDESRRRVEAELNATSSQRSLCWSVHYVYDPSITGAAAARNRAMAAASGDIWLFLDDDVYLEPDFIDELVGVYRDHPEAIGVSGIITNYPRPPLAYRLWSGAFMRGPFYDERQPIYWNAELLRGAPPIRVHRFGGGLMSFRAGAIRDKRFDENLRGVSDGEDVDFCSRLGQQAVLLLAPRARLEHKQSPQGRLADHWLRRHARGNIFVYQKNWSRVPFNRICYWWLWVGYCSIAVIASSRRFSLEPWRALRTGASEAAKALAAKLTPTSAMH